MKYASSVSELIGDTPLYHPSHFLKRRNLQAKLLLKLECFNPGGSAKDRVGLALLEDALEKGLLHEGGTIIEPTSGNTGVGLAVCAISRGFRVILTMPETMSIERRRLLAAYGAEIILTDGARGMSGAIEKAKALAREIPGSYIPGQFDNRANALAHYRTTGPEIWRDTDRQTDIFVAGIGTGGTITGVGEYLKEQNASVQIIGVEPSASAVLNGGSAGKHDLQGIGAGFVPKVLNTSILDRVIPVTDEEAYAAARALAREEGILCGITSGAALHAAVTLAAQDGNAGKTIVALMPDTGERYLSTKLFAEE